MDISLTLSAFFFFLVLYAKSRILKRIGNRECLTVTHGQVKVAVVSTIYLKILRKKDKKKDPKERRMEHGWAWLGG